MSYSFFIDYNIFLPNGLRSPAGGPGRWLLGLAMILGRMGHSVDVMTERPWDIPSECVYPGVTFIDMFDKSLDSKEYDVCFWNGFSRDEPIRKAKLYFYIEFFRNWEVRKLQVPFLRKDNVYIAYPFESSATLFCAEDNEFASKCVHIPYPVCEEVKQTNNYHCSNWCVSLKDYQWPHRFKDNLQDCFKFLEEFSVECGNQMAPFPRGDKPLQEVLDTLATTRLLFPFSQSGSSLEASANGVVTFPIFGAEEHVKVHLPMGPSSLNSGLYQEYPVDLKVFREKI
jgi:hypothetical protein